MIGRREFIGGGIAATALASSRLGAVASESQSVRIETRETIGKLPHVWEESVGSDRAAITLREQWREDFRLGVNQAGFKRARFHGIFNDELGVLGSSIVERQRGGRANWQNVFRVYDGLIECGGAPFIELTFMPSRLASGKAQFGFYGGNTTPPTSAVEYGAFIKTFAQALIQRYGLETVRAWPFEVWNEPNLPFFWTGDKARYFELYKAAAVAIKSVDAQLSVGGPATSGAAWIPEFGNWCADNNAPLDFFTTHSYAGDVDKNAPARSINDAIPEAIGQVRRQIDAGPLAGRPLWLSEWSSDSPAMIAHVIKHTMEHCEGMSQWVLSGIYEELGPDNYILKEGSMGWSMVIDGIAKPSFNTYRLLHRLGTRRLYVEGPALASRREDGKVSAVVWNLAEVAQPGGIPGMSAERIIQGSRKRIDVAFAGARAKQPVKVTFVDWERGSPMPAWRQMGSPQYLSREQVFALRHAAQPVSRTLTLDAGGRLILDLPPEGVALVEFL